MLGLQEFFCVKVHSRQFACKANMLLDFLMRQKCICTTIAIALNVLTKDCNNSFCLFFFLFSCPTKRKQDAHWRLHQWFPGQSKSTSEAHILLFYQLQIASTAEFHWSTWMHYSVDLTSNALPEKTTWLRVSPNSCRSETVVVRPDNEDSITGCCCRLIKGLRQIYWGSYNSKSSWLQLLTAITHPLAPSRMSVQLPFGYYFKLVR